MDNSLAIEPTRRDMLLGMLQKEYPNYHPLISIARIAHDEGADLKLQFECHKTVAKYVEPELKSIEVKGEINGRHRVTVSLFDPVEGDYAEVQLPEQRPGATRSSAKALTGGDIGVQDAEFLEIGEQVDRRVANW